MCLGIEFDPILRTHHLARKCEDGPEEGRCSKEHATTNKYRWQRCQNGAAFPRHEWILQEVCVALCDYRPPTNGPSTEGSTLGMGPKATDGLGWHQARSHIGTRTWPTMRPVLASQEPSCSSAKMMAGYMQSHT